MSRRRPLHRKASTQTVPEFVPRAERGRRTLKIYAVPFPPWPLPTLRIYAVPFLPRVHHSRRKLLGRRCRRFVTEKPRRAPRHPRRRRLPGPVHPGPPQAANRVRAWLGMPRPRTATSCGYPPPPTASNAKDQLPGRPVDNEPRVVRIRPRSTASVRSAANLEGRRIRPGYGPKILQSGNTFCNSFLPAAVTFVP